MKLANHQAAGAGAPANAVLDPLQRAKLRLARGSLRLALVFAAADAGAATLDAILNGGPSWRVPEGLALVLAALSALACFDQATKWLNRPGVPALITAIVGVAIAVDDPSANPYSIVAFAVVVVAAVVSTPRWLSACIVLSLASQFFGLVGEGHSAQWILTGGGEYAFANEGVDLALTAGIVASAITVMNRVVAGAGESLAQVHAGGPSITPHLTILLHYEPRATLPRADSKALVALLTPAEDRVLALVAAGHGPIAAAHQLGVQISTARSHIASAKRKTGARTLEQLIGIYAEATP